MSGGERTDEQPSATLTELVADSFGVTLRPSEGWAGEESVGWRTQSPAGERFVQRLAPWRDISALEWCDAVARSASMAAPECVHAIPSRTGAAAVMSSEGPVMVFPYVEGTHGWYEGIELDAAALLARIHKGLATSWPGGSVRAVAHGRDAGADGRDRLVDDELDRWERSSTATPATLPIHGDYYAGNLLTRDDVIVGVIDWSDAYIAPQEREVSWAVWEFCHTDEGDDLVDEQAEAFLRTYIDAGGPAPVAKPFDPCPWIRVRLRAEARAWFADPRSQSEISEYHEAEVVAFERLRSRRLPGR